MSNLGELTANHIIDTEMSETAFSSRLDNALMEQGGNEVQTGEEAISDGYKNAYKELIEKRGYSPRRARRYLDSIAKRRVKKFVKNHKSKMV